MRQTSFHVARHFAESYSVALQYCTFNLAVKKTVGDAEKLLTYLNSVLKFYYEQVFSPCAKKVTICCQVRYLNIHIFSLFFPFNLAVTKKP
jgi:hypothetical protein